MQKTDNAEFFEYTKQSLLNSGFLIERQTDDLHSCDIFDGNIVTEYEAAFSSKGMPIYALIAKKADNV